MHKSGQAQNVYNGPRVDGIDYDQYHHNPEGLAVRIPEGYVWSSLTALPSICSAPVLL